MPIHEIAALGAAFCWALSALLAAGPSQYLGAIAFTRLRLVVVFVILGLYALFTGGWATIGRPDLLPIVASGLTGIFLGDTALFMTMNRLGPRRTNILFAMNAPISAVLGWLILDEVLSLRGILGIAVAGAGVVLAILFGKRRAQLHRWESVKGPLWIGVAFGLTAALGQSLGSLIIRPVMETGIDPVSVSALRAGVAAVALTTLGRSSPLFRQANPLTWRIAGQATLSGILAMALGMTFVLFALSGGKVGIVATLSATTPALLLPFLWLRTREAPALGAWIGAALVITGSALIFTR
jgi:drug/metabolite transporter (DMT)-like permease